MASTVGPLHPSWAPVRSTALFSAQALEVQGQTPAPDASWDSPSPCRPRKALARKGGSVGLSGPLVPERSSHSWNTDTRDSRLPDPQPWIREAAAFAGSPGSLPLLHLWRPLAAPGSNSTYPADDAMSWRVPAWGRGPGNSWSGHFRVTLHHLHMLRPLKQSPSYNCFLIQ